MDQRRLWTTFVSLFRALAARDGLEVCLLDHWDGEPGTEVWLADENYVDDRIIEYLADNELDLVANGRVKIAVYSRAQRCTLQLTEHKLIAFYADDAEDLTSIENEVCRLGFAKADNLESIEGRCFHHHYKPAGALDRSALRERLRSDGFKVIDEPTSDD